MASIAEILLAQGQQAAATRQRLGEIQGQMYGNIGNTIAAIPGQIQQQQAAARRSELETMQLANARQQQQGQGVVDAALKDYQPSGPQPEGDGPAPAQHAYLDDKTGLYDVPKLTGVLAANGMGHLAPELLKGVENINDSITKHQEAQQKLADATTIMYGDMADGVLKLNKAGLPFDQALDHVAQPALATKRLNPQQYQQMKAQLLQLPPDQQQAALGQMMDQAAKIAPQKDLAKDAKRLDRYDREIASNVDPNEGGYTINGQRFKKDGTPIGTVQPSQTAPKDWQKSSVLLDGKPAEILTDPAPNGKIYDLNRQPIENAATRIKPIPSAAALNVTAGALSDVAMEQAARKYLETGQLPPGFGTAGVMQKTAIMNAAAKLDPNAALARNQATYKADSANLTNLQKTEGTLAAFENTAGKNLDQFLATASKIPDTGVPWINRPIRAVASSGLGSTEQAAFTAARDVALREIARVTNDPKLSGALTDSARAEVAGLSPSSATFAQIKRVAQVLKQDMANVHSGLKEQIASVQSGIGQNPTAPAKKPTAEELIKKYGGQ